MQELLTKGIGPDGKPHTEFKDAPVGRIPVELEVSTIEAAAELIKPGPFGSAIKKSMYKESGYRVYGQEQVIGGSLKIGDYYIDEEKYEELKSFRVKSKDILISLVGTIGNILIVPEDHEPGVINPRLLLIRFSSEVIDIEFIAYQLQSSVVRDQLELLQQGGTMGVLSATTIKPVLIFLPPLKTQVSFRCALQSIDGRISSAQQRLEHYQYLKKALMQDLLTGKVRVTPDPE